MISMWYESVLTNNWFRVYIILFKNKQLLSASNVTSIPHDSWRPLISCYNFTDKKAKMATAKKPFVCLFALSQAVILAFIVPLFKVRVFTNDYQF